MKMDLMKITAASALAAMFAAAPAGAVTFGDGGASLQAALDNIAVDDNIDLDVTTDYIPDSQDSYWQIGGSGGAITTVVFELAGGFSQNLLFGIFDLSDPTKRVQVFGGAAATGSQTSIGILADGSVLVGFADTGIDFAGNRFGFYLDSSFYSGGGLFFSDTLLNADGVDHMAAYQGTGEQIQILPFAAGPWAPTEFIFAWEDLYGGGDLNYRDFVVLVESIDRVPEPGSLALLSLGLIGLGAAARRRKAA